MAVTVTIGHASIDERGKGRGGQAGDQTGREVCTRTWYNPGWNKLIRAKLPEIAEGIAKAMEAATANDNIGYDMSQRTTMFMLAQANGWNIAAINQKCETDCSNLVATCVNAAGVPVSKDIYTGNQAVALKATGKFDILTESKYLTSDKYLQRGDILLREGKHTVVVLSNGELAAVKPAPVPSAPVVAPAPKPQISGLKDLDTIAREVLAGKWGNGPERKMNLEKNGYKYSEVQGRVNALAKKGK